MIGRTLKIIEVFLWLQATKKTEETRQRGGDRAPRPGGERDELQQREEKESILRMMEERKIAFEQENRKLVEKLESLVNVNEGRLII